MARSRRSAFPRNNPYNFVPGDTPIKMNAQAPTLSQFKDLSGSIECRLATETPLMIGGERDDSSRPQRVDFFKINGHLAIPGTSLKGMVRSVLEAVTNACFVVFDGEKLDYRTPRINLKAGQVIRKASNGQLGQIRQTERGWIAMQGRPTNILGIQGRNTQTFTLASVPDSKESGETVWIKYQRIDRYRNSRGRTIPGPFFLVTSISSNQKPGYTEGIYKITGQSINNKKRERIFFSTNGSEIYSFSKQEVEDYDYILKQQLERQQTQGGFQLRERAFLSKGALVYFQPQPGNQAKFISRVEIPRIRYAISRQDLLPDEYDKCTDPNNLCAACGLFGFVQKDERLSGRIIFTDAEHISGSGEAQDYLNLKVLGTPHPTSGNFYLKDPKNPSKVRNYDGYEITDNRGRIGNQKGPVQLRGRKFYYHHPLYGNLQQYCCDPKETSDKLYSRAKPVLADNTFLFKIHFRNLSTFELGLLIYGLELEADLRHKLGMGKTIGFGTVKIEIDSLKVLEDPKSQYLDFEVSAPPEKSESKASYVENFKNQVTQLLEKPFEELLNIQKLRKILDPSKAPSNIGYPAGGYRWYMNNRNVPLPPL